MKYACVFLMSVAGINVGVAIAHTPAETNQIVSAALDYVRMHGHRQWKSARRDYDLSTDPNTWQTFLRFGGEAWTMDERRAAFDQYLTGLGSSNLKDVSEEEQMRVHAAIDRCRLLNYTNSTSALVALALNANGVHRDFAIEVALGFMEVNDNTTTFVETIITNISGYAAEERVECYWGYAAKLQSLASTDEALRHPIVMFYRNRKLGVTGAVTTDKLLSDKLPCYAISSNRIDTACFMLSATNASPALISYFTSVTNQLRSSGQPLPWIEVGTGGN